MDFKKIQASVNKTFSEYLKYYKIKSSDDYLALKLSEEAGEFVQSYLTYKKKCRPVKFMPSAKAKKELAKEMSDVIAMTMVIAKKLNIDVEEALLKKWHTKEWLKD